jgi:hypothetical protein
LHPCVDLPGGSYTRVPEEGEGGADEDVHYVVAEKDLDQSPEGPKVRTICGSRTGGWSLTCVMSD